MKRNKKKLLATVLLFTITMFIVISFALFGKNIEGMNFIKSSSWNIHFANLDNAIEVGEALEISSPTFSTTIIKDFSVSLRRNKDSIAYRFDVINSGEYDAQINSIITTTPTCIGNGSYSTNDASIVCQNLKYILTYSNGAKVKIGDIISKKQKRKMILKVLYENEDINNAELVKSDVAIYNLELKILYSQL